MLRIHSSPFGVYSLLSLVREHRGLQCSVPINISCIATSRGLCSGPSLLPCQAPAAPPISPFSQRRGGGLRPPPLRTNVCVFITVEGKLQGERGRLFGHDFLRPAMDRSLWTGYFVVTGGWDASLGVGGLVVFPCGRCHTPIASSQSPSPLSSDSATRT